MKPEQITNEPITIVINYQIKNENEESFRKVIANIIDEIKAFPGFSGKQFFYTKFPDKTDYYVLVRFDNLEQWKNWEASEPRAKLRAKIDELITLQEPSYHYLTGLESWFSLGVNHPIIPPPRYKIALLTWVSVFSLLLLIFTFFGGFLASLVMPVRVFIVSLTMVLLITYVIMPFLTRLLKHWLYPMRK